MTISIHFGLYNCLLEALSKWSWCNSNTGKIPRELGTLSYLQACYLHSNKLSGELKTFTKSNTPCELWLLLLVNYGCCFSRLSGKIPRSIQGLKNLVFLTLDKLRFTGAQWIDICAYSCRCCKHNFFKSNTVVCVCKHPLLAGGTEHIFHLESLSKVPFEGFWDAYIVPAELEKADLQSKFAHFRNLKTVWVLFNMQVDVCCCCVGILSMPWFDAHNRSLHYGYTFVVKQNPTKRYRNPRVIFSPLYMKLFLFFTSSYISFSMS